MQRAGNAYLNPEFVGCLALAFGNALRLRCVPSVELRCTCGALAAAGLIGNALPAQRISPTPDYAIVGFVEYVFEVQQRNHHAQRHT